MKILREEAPAEAVAKGDTVVGELYEIAESNNSSVYFRCQGGFANMATGGYTPYESARTHACWVHLPDAVIQIPA